MPKKKHQPDEAQRKFGRQLAEIRKNNHLTQKQVANQLQVERSTYTYYETGKIQITLFRLVKMAEVFDISPLELFEMYLQLVQIQEK